MGFFRFLKEHAAASVRQSESSSESRIPRVTTIERDGDRTWLFVAEYGEKGSLEPNGSISLNVENAVGTRASLYFQEQLARVSGDTILVRAVEQCDAVLPPDWTYFDESEMALVGENAIAISLIDRDKIAKAGFSAGDYMRCAVVRPPYAGLIILHVLMTEDAIKAEDDRVKVQRLRAISSRSGIEVTDESLMANLYPKRGQWTGGDWPTESTYFTPSFEKVTPKKGSKAKPHILVRDGDRILYEVTGRNAKAYKTINDNLNRPCKGRIAVDYYGEGMDDVRIILVFEGRINTARERAGSDAMRSQQGDDYVEESGDLRKI